MKSTQREVATEDDVKERIAPANKAVNSEKLLVVRVRLHTMKLSKFCLDLDFYSTI